jgi:hypothetical protein
MREPNMFPNSVLNLIERLKYENEQLREALKMCNPFTRRGLCEFCLYGNWEHEKDCEYIRLIGGNEND